MTTSNKPPYEIAVTRTPSSVFAPTFWSICSVLSGLLRFVLKMPDSLVFGRILPATGLMMCMSTMYYAWLAYGLARNRRTDVCALPSGSASHTCSS